MSASVHDSGGQGPVFRTPEKALRQMHALLGAGYGELANAKVQGSEKSIAFAQKHLNEVGKLLEQAQHLPAKDLEKVHQKKAGLEAKIKNLTSADVKQKVSGKLWGKVYGSSPFTKGTKIADLKFSVEELDAMYHADIANGTGKKGEIKEALLQHGDKLEPKFQKLAKENDPAKLRQDIKSGKHQELLDYHFAALKIDDPANKQTHLKAIAILMLKAKMVGLEFFDPRTRGNEELNKVVFEKAKEMLSPTNHETPLYLKSALLNRMGNLLPAEQAGKLKEECKIDLTNENTQARFLKEVSLEGKPVADLGKMAFKVMKSRTPEGMEKARLALMIGNEKVQKGKPHGKDWDNAAKAYVETYMSAAETLHEHKADRAALVAKDMAWEIYSLRSPEDKKTDGLGNRMSALLTSLGSKEDAAAKASLDKAKELASKSEQIAVNAFSLGLNANSLLEEDRPVVQIETLIKQLKAMRPEGDKGNVNSEYGLAILNAEAALESAQESSRLPPTFKAVPPIPERTSASAAPSTISLNSETSSLESQGAVSSMMTMSSPLNDSRSGTVLPNLDTQRTRTPPPLPSSPPRRVQEYRLELGNKPIDDPSRSMENLYKLRALAKAAGNEPAVKEIEKAGNARLEKAASLGRDLFLTNDAKKMKKLIEKSPKAFNDLIENAFLTSSRGDKEMQALAAFYIKSKQAGITLEGSISEKLEGLKWEINGVKSPLVRHLESQTSKLLTRTEQLSLILLGGWVKEGGPANAAVWIKPEWSQMRSKVLEHATGDNMVLRKYVFELRQNNEMKQIGELFSLHEKFTHEVGVDKDLESRNLDALADLLIFMARAGTPVNIESSVKRLGTATRNELSTRVAKQIKKLPEAERAQVASKIQNVLNKEYS